MSNIDKQAYRADGGDIGTGRIREIADNPYGDEEKCWLANRVLALLNELEAKDKRIAELSALQGKPIAWESTTPVYVKFISDERYQRLRPVYKKWYKPYRCSQCAAAGKGEAS